MSRDYLPKIDRRTTLKWLAAGVGMASTAAACGRAEPELLARDTIGEARPISGTPYGGDPDIMNPAATWERTLTQGQLALVAAVGDIIMPATDDLPAASAVGVPDFIDEFISSPYEQTQQARTRCLALFDWIETRALETSKLSFVDAPEETQTEILDQIAWRDRVGEGLQDHARAFNTFRSLVVSAYFASDAGMEWLGYMGNRPGVGDYAGPTEAALAHLADAMAPLGLTIPQGL